MPEFLRPKSSESCRILSILNLGTLECFVSPCVKEEISLIDLSDDVEKPEYLEIRILQ